MLTIVLDKSGFQQSEIKVSVSQSMKFQKQGMFFDDHLTIYHRNEVFASLSLSNGPVIYCFTRAGSYEVRTLNSTMRIECFSFDLEFTPQELLNLCPPQFPDEIESVELQAPQKMHETQSEARFGENLEDASDERDEVRSAYFQEISKNTKKKQLKHAFSRDRNLQFSQADSQSTHHTSTLMHPKIETLSNYDENYQLQFQNESTQKGRKNSDPLIKSIKEPLKKIRIPKQADNQKPAHNSSETDSSDLNKHYLEKMEEFVVQHAPLQTLQNLECLEKASAIGEIMQDYLDNDFEILKQCYQDLILK